MRVSPFLWVLGSCLATLLRHYLQKTTILRFILSYIPVRNCLIPNVKPLKSTNCEESEMAIGNIGNDVIQTFGTAAQPIRNEHPPMRNNVMEFRRGPLMITVSMSSFYDEAKKEYGPYTAGSRLRTTRDTVLSPRIPRSSSSSAIGSRSSRRRSRERPPGTETGPTTTSMRPRGLSRSTRSDPHEALRRGHIQDGLQEQRF